MKFWKTPTPDQVTKAVALLGRKEQYRYFFDRLENPLWLEPLRKKGFFQTPPSPQVKEGAITFPPWPESQYLARMAKLPEVHQQVRGIALAIPHTENVLVHEDLAEITLSLPAGMAVAFVPKAKQWIASPSLPLLLEKLGALVAHLAREGEEDAALDLARAVLIVLPEPEEQTRPLTKSRGRFDVWHYEQVLEKHLPALVEATGERALQLLCDLLEPAIRLSQRLSANEAPEDFSYRWRLAIESHAQNLSHSLEDALVSALRDAAEQLAHHDLVIMPKLIALLESRTWRIFHRIALHLLRRFPDAALSLIAERLTNRKYFDELGLRHEYVLLLREYFKGLEPNQQGMILQWIEAGPDLEPFKHRREEVTGQRPSEGEMAQYRKFWQRDRLAPLADSLPVDWQRRYGELVAELGPPELAEFVSMTKSWKGPISPKSLDELRAMGVDALVAYLKTWKPPHELMAPSPEGLRHALADLVKTEPERFVQKAGKFKGLDPIYVRAFLDGLRDAASQQRAFPWEPVLRLAQWVMEQPRDIPGRRGEYTDLESGWVWFRETIAGLLSTGFEQNPAEISFDLRDCVWNILRPITDDPDPTPEDESRYRGSKMEPATLSINRTRGKAMHTVVRYALWVWRHLESTPDGSVRIQHGFAEMPEVREVLDLHLDLEHDPALLIRSVYGEWFPWLMLLDATWAASQVGRIFPPEPSERDYRNAAWETYIVFCSPYDNVFDLLREEYERAIEQIDSSSSDYRYLVTNPNQRLAEHLMIFYWRGKLSLEYVDSLLGRFYAKASDGLRGHALTFVGRTLCEASDQEMLERLKALWSYRLEFALTAPSSDDFTKELASFGWWFASGKFDAAWSLEQLQAVLGLVKKAKPDHLVAERLAQIAGSDPLKVVQCLTALIEGDREGWRMSVWEEHVRTILATAMESTSAEAREAATTLVHNLGARGYLNFRNLLRSS